MGDTKELARQTENKKKAWEIQVMGLFFVFFIVLCFWLFCFVGLCYLEETSVVFKIELVQS